MADILKTTFSDVFPFQLTLMYFDFNITEVAHKVPLNKLPLIQIMTWCQITGKPSARLMMVFS